MESLNRRRYRERRERDLPPSNTIYYTTNDGNIVNVHNYWTQPIFNEYNKNKDLGVMVFETPLTEIWGISGHPFLYDQKNLLTLKLPTTITKLGRGCFYGCSNLYKVNVEDLVLEELEWACFENTAIQQLDFRKSLFTELVENVFYVKNNSTIDYILCPDCINKVDQRAFNYSWSSYAGMKIKTLMIPTLNKEGNYFIEYMVLENLIINKFDGLGDLHSFNTDCVIWVPDEFYDGYIEKYTNNDDVQNWQDIISRLRKYSEGVPQFPSK